MSLLHILLYFSPVIIVVYLGSIWAYRRLRVKNRRSKFRLIQGGKKEEGPYGKTLDK